MTRIPVGLLYSTSGTYAAIGRDCLDGAVMALAEINADPSFDFTLAPVTADPAASISRYHQFSEMMLREKHCSHILGTITSISRKEIIPIIEKHDALLWYVSPYEGFESCENVIYTGACPNQHIVPLFTHLIPKHGSQVYLTGSNYIWGWEVNRIARELIVACGGEVLGERYLALDSVDIERLIDDIKRKKPDFILNNLIGPSSYAFLRAYHELARANPEFHPSRRPVVSCNLTECEIEKIGTDVAEGHISAAIYFDAVNGDENEAFRARVSARFGADRRVSAFFVGGYTAALMLAQAIRDAGTDEIEAVKRVLHARPFDTPLGRLTVDARTNHAALRSYLSQITAEGHFSIISASDQPVAADPYMVHFNAEDFAAAVSAARPGDNVPYLRVVK